MSNAPEQNRADHDFEIAAEEGSSNDAPSLDAMSGDAKSDDTAMSASSLSAAFAKLSGSSSPDISSPGSTDEEGASREQNRFSEEKGFWESETSDGCPVTAVTIVEAIIFVGHPDSEPVSADSILKALRGVEADELQEIVKQLNGKYTSTGSPYWIKQIDNGFRLELHEHLGPLRAAFHGRMREVQLNQAALDTLAAVAYHGSLTSEEVVNLRGRASGSVLGQLVRRELLRVELEKDKKRTKRYFPTDRFLKLFGIDSLEELPRSREVDVK